jgi:peptidoglycan/xylan/chitin deacetylase (PgdA/CDA1 family)
LPFARAVFWLFCAATFSLAVAALLGIRPPTWQLVGFGLLFFSFATLGVLFPQLQMYGSVLCRGAAGKQRIALSFDDGPHPETTRKILAILADNNALATFFVVGHKVERHPDVVREIVAAGHALGIHGFFHDRIYSLRSGSHVARDIARTRAAIAKASGKMSRLFRPPVGFLSLATARAAARAGLTTVAWSARGLDGVAFTQAARVVARIEPELTDGAIVLLHDAAERDDFVPASIEALPRLLLCIRERGLRCVTLEEFVAD